MKSTQLTNKGEFIVNLKLELVLVPVSDVDRAKAFYTEKAGFNLDVDHRAGDDFRVVQMTPPGSACSISIGKGITNAAPGSIVGLHLVVTDIVAARVELVQRGVDVSEIRHLESGNWVPALILSGATMSRSPTSGTPTATAGSCRRSGAASPERDGDQGQRQRPCSIDDGSNPRPGWRRDGR